MRNLACYVGKLNVNRLQVGSPGEASASGLLLRIQLQSTHRNESKCSSRFRVDWCRRCRSKLRRCLTICGSLAESSWRIFVVCTFICIHTNGTSKFVGRTVEYVVKLPIVKSSKWDLWIILVIGIDCVPFLYRVRCTYIVWSLILEFRILGFVQWNC